MVATTNLRKIRLKDNGRWTLFGTQDEQKLEQQLCAFCATEATCLAKRRVDKATTDFGVVANITQCASFRPTLGFQKLDGLDSDIFNTFRLGAAWAARVRCGHIVTLYDTARNEVIGTAEVQDVHCGPYREIARLHAHTNHMLIGKFSQDPYKDMLTIMRRAYGSNYFTEDRNVSIIYLRRHREGEEAKGGEGSPRPE